MLSHFSIDINLIFSLGNLQNYDKVIVMEDGRIVEMETPQKLLSDQNSLFNKMMKEEMNNQKTED